MKVAVIGALRRNNGIGPYMCRYLHLCGARVEAVLARSEAGAGEAASLLGNYGITASPFHDFDEMISAVSPDAVVIASPTSTHRYYVELCCDAGVSFLCDKPFVSPHEEDAMGFVGSVISQARKRGVTVAMNSQWPFSIPFYERLCGRLDPQGPRTFYMRLSPGVVGRDMIPDSLPHALSMLYCVAGSGRVRDVYFEKGTDTLFVSFVYKGERAAVQARIELRFEASQPRTFAYGFDGRIATRRIDTDSYAMFLSSLGREIGIPDPLELSMRDFVQALAQGREPQVGGHHIMDTMRNLCEIYEHY